ncbi:MAG: agmatinase [Desulfobacteraceae bacterium A6]|nr:MAG: agmatinase [Desulfobacteraceae bacterium A6]
MKSKKSIRFGDAETPAVGLDDAGIVVLPLCYENAPSYGTGSENGPLHILSASAQLESIDEETLTFWGEAGIHTLPPLVPSKDPKKAVNEMKRAAAAVLEKNKFLLSLGGDHAISIGPIMAAAEIHPDIGVLQIDAHLDLRDTWNGSKYNHACVMRRVVEDLNLPVAQVGIRSFSPEEADYVKRKKLKPFYAHTIDPSDDYWRRKVVHSLPEKVYITIDLDGLDPSILPGTGTPEPGGLSYRQLIKLIKVVGKERKVIAADINELVKIEGFQVSEYTAAKIATKIFVYCL